MQLKKFIEQTNGDPKKSFYDRIAMAESGGKNNAVNPAKGATASGKYQFIESTWKEMVDKYNLGYSLNDRFNPEKSQKVMELFTKENENYLTKKLGRSLNDADLYSAHFLGAGGAEKFLKAVNKNPNKLATEHFSERVLSDNKSVMYNKDGTPRTVGAVYAELGRRIGDTSSPEVVQEETPQQKELTDLMFTNYLPNIAGIDLGTSEEETADDKVVKETEKELQKEDRKLNAFDNYKQQQEQLAQLAPQQQEQEDTFSAIQTFQGVDQFVSQPLMQNGGETWQTQQERLKAEKEAKLKELLKRERDIVERLKKEKGQTKSTTAKDNTSVVTNNKAEKVSKSARNKTDKEIAQDREAKIQESLAYQDIPFTQDNWRDVLAKSTQSTGDKLRVSLEPNFFDDYLNPAVMIGAMASSLGQAPQEAIDSDSVLPYFTSVGTPLAVGALAGIGANSTGQFVNNLANPLAGVRTSVPEELKQGLNSQGFLDMFKSKPKFNSEIDWAKWNKEIPSNQPLLQEYNAIEQSTKKAGTWMKNPDGSAFQGTPEQFVQQNSQNFKKAFPNVLRDELGNVQKTYHGSQDKFESFDPSIMRVGRTRGQGIYTSPVKERAASYADKGEKQLYEFYQNANKKQTIVEDFNASSQKRFDKFLKENPKGSKDFDKKFKSFIDEEDIIFNRILTDDIFNLKEGYDFYKVSSDEYVVPFTNYPKSAIGNNGMFDMTNPNIYKSIVPIAGASYLATQQEEYQNGGETNNLEQLRNKFRETLKLQRGGKIPVSPNGLYDYPNQTVRVPTDGSITMKGLDYPVLGTSDQTGEQKLMLPGMEYFFSKTNSVTERPLKNKIK